MMNGKQSSLAHSGRGTFLGHTSIGIDMDDRSDRLLALTQVRVSQSASQGDEAVARGCAVGPADAEG